jgi:hypothetical protein
VAATNGINNSVTQVPSTLKHCYRIIEAVAGAVAIRAFARLPIDEKNAITALLIACGASGYQNANAIRGCHLFKIKIRAMRTRAPVAGPVDPSQSLRCRRATLA